MAQYLDWYHGVYEDEFKAMDTVKLEDYLLPDPDDDSCLLTEDYPDAELMDMWDGCWSYWNVKQHGESDKHLSEEECVALSEEVEELYNDGWNEAVEADDWEHCDGFTEIHCNLKITPCDKNGKTEE